MMKSGKHGGLVGLWVGVLFLAAGVAPAAPDIGFYCDYDDNQDLDIGTPATGTLETGTTVSGGKLLVPTNIPAGVTYGMARQYLNTGGAGWGSNTIAAILKWNSVDANRHVIYSSAGTGGADNSWGMFFYINNKSPAIQINANGTPLIDIQSSGVNLLSNVDYFVAASWNDQGSSSPMQATIYVVNRQTMQSWFTNVTGSMNTPAPPNTSGGAQDPLGTIRVGGRRHTGGDPLNSAVDAIWGIRQFTATSNAYAQLFSDLGADQVPAVRVALSGDNSDGSTWAKAYTNLQTAINSSNAVYGVWVKEGVYALTNPIVMANGISVYGGFKGDEATLSQRDWRTYVTVLSNAVTATQQDPNHRIFNCDGKADWRLDGLTICNGQFWSTNVFNDYSANRGAGIRALNVTGNCAIDNCVIRDCRPANTNLYAGGLALSVDSPHTVQLNNTVLYNNQGTSGGGAILAGNGAITLKNCMIVANRGISSGNGNGAGLLISGSAVKIVNCVFYGNYWVGSDRGSAIRVDGANALIANCVFMTNQDSAAIAELQTTADPQVLNCLFFNNYRVYRDEAATDFTDVSQLNALAEAEDNLSGNPLFANPATLDFSILAFSPCVDAGTSASGNAPSSDYYGNPRPMDWPGRGADGTGTEYDIGIHEVVPPPRGTIFTIR